MALTNTLQLQAEFAGRPHARQFPGSQAPVRVGTSEVPISVRADEPFEPHIRQAAEARRFVEEDAGSITWWLHMPGAGRKNTEVIWDPQRRKLSVGAWSRSVAPREGRSPGRLLWYSSTWQPGADGARGTVSLQQGWVVVRMPRSGSD